MIWYRKTLGVVCLLFLKIVLCFQKQGKHVWFPVCFFLKTQKTLNLKNKEEFSENTFLVSFVFSKIGSYGTSLWKEISKE